MIEKLKPTDVEDFPFKDENDLHHRSKADYLQTEYLGFCGCGNPNEVMGYVYDMLKKLDAQQWNDYKDIQYMFFVYWANDKGFAEHGTTARCSWLTGKGKELLRDIKQVIESDEL